jgi:peroxiredoxin Q/BCP
VGLQKRYPEIKKLGGEVVGISSDPPSTVRGTTKGWRLTFSLLPDPEMKIIRAYSVYNSRTRLAHPTTLILDREGRVRWVYSGKNYIDRPDAESVLKELRKLASGTS